jgi:NitT/TauT family transport system substrate-binding protein
MQKEIIMYYQPDNKKRPSILRIVFALFLISGFLAGSASCGKQEKQTGPREKATIGIASLILSAPIIIAQEKGYFSDEGLDIVLKFYPFGKKAMDAMFAGEVDISTVAETPIVFNSFIRDDFAVFASFVYSYDDSKMLGRKDRGIGKPSDLKGKKIGITIKTSSHFFTTIYLAEYGIKDSDVTLVDISAPDLPVALKEGKVDAIAAFEPYGLQVIQALPDRIIRLPGSNLFKETFNLTTMKSYSNGHPEVLKKILKAVDRSIMFIKQNKKESISIMAKVIKLDEDELVSIWDDFVFELSFENSLLTIFEDEARWAIKNSFTDKTKVPNYLGYVYPDALKAIKPDAVTIIKQE